MPVEEALQVGFALARHRVAMYASHIAVGMFFIVSGEKTVPEHYGWVADRYEHTDGRVSMEVTAWGPIKPCTGRP